MLSEAHRDIRVPVFAPVTVESPRPLGTMYAWNISGGGVYLKAPGLAEGDLPLHATMRLAFALPDCGPPIEVVADVVWVDPAERDHRGERALGVGARFSAFLENARDRLRTFVETFRYRVVLLSVEDRRVCEEAFGDLFQIDTADSEAHLLEIAGQNQVGAIVVGEREGAERALLSLQHITESTLSRQPPILYLGRAGKAQLEPVFTRNARVSYARLPIDALELRTLARRAIEAFATAAANDMLTAEVRRALEQARRENAYLKEQAHQPLKPPGLVGESDALHRVFDLAERVAPLPTTVLILGETGTGKELLAKAIHEMSPRRDAPFTAINCAALAEGILDAELFGHVRGAFTGAVSDRPGLFEASHGGTVFLDEVGEMPAAMQAKLLRVLESGEVRRIGDARVRQVDARIISATHRDLASLVGERRFREDLYYRLKAFFITIPPLRERAEDIPPLVLHFLERLTVRHGHALPGFSAEAMALLEAYGWPGNARELLHTVERMLLLAPQGARVDAGLVRETLGLGAAPVRRSLSESLRVYERTLIQAELQRAGGVIAQAARALGVERTTLSKRCKQLGLRT